MGEGQKVKGRREEEAGGEGTKWKTTSLLIKYLPPSSLGAKEDPGRSDMSPRTNNSKRRKEME